MINRNINLTFAGQAGFIIENSAGFRVGVDLYLSDCCSRYVGFKRLLPYLFDPLKLNLDLLIATHAHYDHFDPDAVPLIMSEPKTRLIAACDVEEEAKRLNLESDRITYLKENECFENEQTLLRAMPCDHGEGTPHAIGLLIETEGKRIYIAGDTCYREDYFLNPILKGVDLMIMPINGAFGNLNEYEGAKAAGVVSPKLTIPCHYWNFAEHGGNPGLFAAEMQEKYSDIPYLLMRPGETILL
ncbi:MAG: MBL fold metallo-hydrolase [Clostridia bacterium]|nr:MBL fold metallo-hydrolase [Clostridia bacterium]